MQGLYFSLHKPTYNYLNIQQLHINKTSYSTHHSTDSWNSSAVLFSLPGLQCCNIGMHDLCFCSLQTSSCTRILTKNPDLLWTVPLFLATKHTFWTNHHKFKCNDIVLRHARVRFKTTISNTWNPSFTQDLLNKITNLTWHTSNFVLPIQSH